MNPLLLTPATRPFRSSSCLARTARTIATVSRRIEPAPASTPRTTASPTPRSAPNPSLRLTSSPARHFAKMSKSVAAATHADFNRNSLFDLKGRVALVTGGGSGIGLMITQALAVNGARVYIVGRTGEKLDKVAETYNRDIEGEIVPLTGDVTDKEDVARLVREIESREKCLCILVNNAGVSSQTVQPESGSAEETRRNLFDTAKATADDWTDTYRTDVVSIYFATAAFLPLLQRSSELHPHWSGTVINITSISGLVKGAQHHFAYNAAKGAANHLTRMLAAEIAAAGHKVRVNALAPGVFPSEMTAGGSDEWQKSHLDKSKYESKVPAGRPGRDIDMAQGVLALACNQYIDGQILVVDGGYTLSMGQ